MEKEPTQENIEKHIEGLLERVDGYSEYYNEFPDLQEQWYYTEMEARVGQDREQARARLENFINVLERRIKEKNNS